MNTDIRIATTFFSHRKTLQLQDALGLKGVLGLIKLWCYVGAVSPKGDVSDLTDRDLSKITGISDGEKLRMTLLKIGFLDELDGVTSIHNWQKHNGWAYGAEERSEFARRNARKKWKKQYAPSPEPEPITIPAPPPIPIGKIPITAPSTEPDPGPSPEPVPDSLMPF